MSAVRKGTAWLKTLGLWALLLGLFGCGGRVARVNTGTAVPLPVIMYHAVLKDPARTGAYVVTPAQLEADLRWLEEHGYTAVRVEELVDFVYYGIPLPEKPVLLTFDDGHLNTLTYAVPLLKQYGMTAVVSVVGEYTRAYSQKPDPNPNYAYLTWEDLRLAAEEGVLEVANHSDTMHRQGTRKGCGRLPGESDEAYRLALTRDVTALQQALWQNCGVACKVFTYPFGNVAKGAEEILRGLGFTCTLSCEEKINQLTFGDGESLFLLGRYNRSGKLSTEGFMKKMGLE